MAREPLTHNSADGMGNKAPKQLVGKKFFHPGTQHLYEIMGITFDAERERWMVRYARVNTLGDIIGIDFSHLPEDFGREGRFIEVVA